MKIKNQTLSSIGNFNLRDFLCIFIIIIIGIVLTYKTYNNFFILDDFIHLKEAKVSSQNFSHIFYVHQGFFRPIVNLTFLIFYKLCGLNPTGYFIFNIFLHIINSILVFWLSRELFGNQIFSLLAGIFFVSNSVHAESIFWIGALTGLEVSILYILALIFFMYYCNNQSKYFYSLSLLTYIIGLFTKESIITFPIIASLFYIIYYRDNNFRISKFLKTILPFYIVSFFLIGIHAIINTSDELIQRSDYTIGPHALYQLFIGFFMQIFPPKIIYIFLPVSVDTLEGQEFDLLLNQTGLTEHQIVIFAIIIMLVSMPFFLYILWKILKSDQKHIKFGIGWSIFALIPFIFFVERVYPAFRYLYIPSIGSAILLGSIATLSFSRKTIRMYDVSIRSIVILSSVFWIIANGLTLIIEEKNYANYGHNVKTFISQLTSNRTIFQSDSTILFYNIPVEDLDLKAIVELYLGEKNLTAAVIDNLPSHRTNLRTKVFEYKNNLIKEVPTNRHPEQSNEKNKF